MCGIFGFHDPDGLTHERVGECLDALRRIRHRGPDGEGVLLINTRTGATATLQTNDTPAGVSCDLRIGEFDAQGFDFLLGHRRLSIIDVTTAGHQPMRDAAGNWVGFNGEIYNYIELRDELISLGETFHTGSDTEVLMAAWRRWGADGINRFNGMWAIALWDAQHKKLLLTSDRFGVKPLYLTQAGKATSFASEVKAFKALTGWDAKPHEGALRHFLRSGITEPDGQTLFSQVRRFPPAHYALFAPGESPVKHTKRYWSPSAERSNLSYEQACEAFRELFTSAVRLRMRADVDWGTSLSGGLDSSAIVYVASDLTHRVLQTGQAVRCFSAVFRGLEGDESHFVDRIVKDLGLEARFTNPLEHFTPEDFEAHIYHQDFPVDSTSYYAERCVMRTAAEAGVKVVLDGQGSDELFAGYHHHFYKYLRQLWLAGQWGKFREEAKAFAELKGLDEAKVRATVMADVKGWLRHAASPKRNVMDVWNYSRDTRKVMEADFGKLMLPTYLRTEDRSSMMVSVETRQPFLDYRLVELANSLPLEYKMRKGWQKAIVRDALSILPSDIRYRRDKKGYTTPEGEWLRKHEGFFMEAARTAMDQGLAPMVSLEELKRDLGNGKTPRIVKYASLGVWSRHFA